MSHRKPFLISAASVLLGLLLTGAPSSSSASTDPGGPAIQVPKGWTWAQAKAELAHDPTLNVADDGRLYYEDVLTADAASAVGGPEQVPLVPLGDTFSLHSRPGADKTIYLDFNGHTAVNTLWTTSFGLGTNVVSDEMNLDGTPGFSATELEFIQGVWARVADDYDMFDVDVTTEEPLVTDLVRSDNSDQRYGVRAVITDSNFTSGPNQALGIAFVGVFGAVGVDAPAYVFTRMAQYGVYGYPYAIAHGVSHEVGHTLGLHHDGTTTSGYYGGSATWAPIMGSAGGSLYVTWSKGEYQNANNSEDDLVVMERAGEGVSRLPDQVGATPGSATPLSASGTTFTATGRIETRTDVDLYSIDIGAGQLSVSVAPTAPIEPNLDLELRLLNSGGQAVANGQSNPADRGAPSLSLNLPAGRYYVRVDGVGQGSPLIGGYSDYASLGRYTVTASVGTPPPPPNQPPTAQAAVTPGATALQKNFSSAGSADPESGPLSFQWSFGDNTSSTEANPVHTYVSPGVYTATLVVTDNVNQQASKQIVVVVGDPAKQLKISSIVAVRVSRGTVRVRVTIVDGLGKPVKGASVRGVWAGTTTNRSATTSSKGIATFYRYTSKAAAFTTNRVTKSGRTWDGVNASTGVTAYVR